MSEPRSVSVRMLGSLHSWRKGQGLPSQMTVSVPEQGRRAVDVARDLGLPLETIEAVFCNHVVYDLGHTVRPGDSVAFVPRGTPGPHRYFLGIYDAGAKSDGDAEHQEG